MWPHGEILPVAALATPLWVKELPKGMSAKKMDKEHRVAIGVPGYPQPIAGTDSK